MQEDNGAMANGIRTALHALTITICAGLACCREATIPPQGWIEIKAGDTFTFYAPPGTKLANPDGVPFDSFVQKYSNSNFVIIFDYGYYSHKLDDYASNASYTAQSIQIDGRNALIVTGPGDGGWGCNGRMTALYVVDHCSGPEVAALEMNACTDDPKELPTLHRLFQTIRFKRTR
jgi:hypothetical protein